MYQSLRHHSSGILCKKPKNANLQGLCYNGKVWNEPRVATVIGIRGTIAAFVVACTLGWIATACSSPTPPPPTFVPETPLAVTHVNATPTQNAAARSSRVPVATPITSTGALTLTLWTVEDVTPGSTPAGRILRNQVDAFTAANPNIHIEINPKKAFGKGGILDFLMTTQAIVPARLPDLVVLDLSEIPLAAEARLMQPLDNLLASDVSSDFFPFASQAARFGDRWLAVPFAVNIEHLVYNKVTVRKPPQTWDDFTKQKSALLLPLGGDDGFLTQYLALGASLGTSGSAGIDSGAASQALSFIKRSRDLDLIPDAAINLKTVDEVWSAFAAGQAPMAQVSSFRYMTDRNKYPNAQFAAIPTRDGRLMTLANGWAFAVVTPEPSRQSSAARFIQWIVQGERLAPWLRAARMLPATRATIALAIDPPDYAAFVRDEMERAVALPAPALYSKQAEAWRSAISSVWKGQMTPDEAARLAATVK